MTKLHLGCGHEILPGFVNVDSARLAGVDVVADLSKMPWPFKDGEATEIILKHVLEHLPDTTKVMEEIWRVCSPGAKVVIRIPYWNSGDFITDPTHIRPFNEHTFDFFDPTHKRCQERSYYTTARFRIRRLTCFIRVLGAYIPLTFAGFRLPFQWLAKYLCNIVHVLEFELEAVK